MNTESPIVASFPLPGAAARRERFLAHRRAVAAGNGQAEMARQVAMDNRIAFALDVYRRRGVTLTEATAEHVAKLIEEIPQCTPERLAEIRQRSERAVASITAGHERAAANGCPVSLEQQRRNLARHWLVLDCLFACQE